MDSLFFSGLSKYSRAHAALSGRAAVPVAAGLICLIGMSLVFAPNHVAAQEASEQTQAMAAKTQQGSAAADENDADTDADATMKMDEPERLNLSFKLPAGQAIEVDNPHGSVFLRFGGYEHQLDIRATIQQPSGAPKFAFAPGAREGRFVVAPSLPAGAQRAESQRIDLVLYVPEKHAVRVRTIDGGIESRGLKSDVVFNSESGNISLRGTEGTVQAESAEGRIRAMLGKAPPASYQRFSTRTGDIRIGATDGLDAEVQMATSGTITTDYSLAIEHRDREEPDKRAQATVGAPKAGKEKAVVAVDSLRGNLQLWRRAVFLEADDDNHDAGDAE
jgi:hypothetical protein